jgi:2-octaprenyl-6-methoxyphenol hydroxylase
LPLHCWMLFLHNVVMLTFTTNSLESPSQFDYDVAIVGGGIVGATLAAALKDSGLRIAVIEAQSQSAAIAKSQAYAIHLSSSRILESIGVWSQIEPRVQYFNRVKLSDADYRGTVEFGAKVLGGPVVGHVAEHRVLLEELGQFLEGYANVDWLAPVQVVAAEYGKTGAQLQIVRPPGAAAVSETLTVRLVVAADGNQSRLRQQAGIPVQTTAYWQSCVVATIESEHFHNHIAYERFWPSGPFAILPVSPTCSRIVWTAPHAEAKTLLALDDQAFVQKLTQRYGAQMGKLTVQGQRFAFPARLMHAREYVRSRLALVGDAAHCCHPVGGQGLNLGIRDAAALAEVLQQAIVAGEDIGDLRVLRRYQRWRRWQNQLSLAFTDLLNRLFSNEILPIMFVRRLGLFFLNFQPFKWSALMFMAGLSGKAPRLAQGGIRNEVAPLADPANSL